MRKKKLAILKIFSVTFGLLAISTPAFAESLEDRISELEIAKGLQKFNFSGVMINRFEAFDSSYIDINGAQQRDILRLPGIFLGINTDIDVSARVKVYTTLAMSKFWGFENSTGDANAPWNRSEQGSYGYQGSSPRFDRAYLTYSFDFPLVLAVGRFPTNQGLPSNQLDGLARQGTYPRMAFNGIFDGVAAVYDFSSLLPEENTLKARLFFTPWTNVSYTDRTKQMVDSGKVESITPQVQFLIDYSKKNFLSAMGQLDFESMSYYYARFYWDGSNGTNNGANNYSFVPPNNPGNPYYDGYAETLYLGLNDIGYMGLNVSASGLGVWSKTTGASNPYNKSLAYLLNINQTIKPLGNSILGAEYIHTDDNYYLDEWTYLQLMPFYKTPASAGFHFFYTQPLGDRMTLRVGRYNLETHPSTASFAQFGNQATFLKSASSVSYYAQLRVDF